MKDRETWHAAVHWVPKSRTWLSGRTTTANWLGWLEPGESPYFGSDNSCAGFARERDSMGERANLWQHEAVKLTSERTFEARFAYLCYDRILGKTVGKYSLLVNSKLQNTQNIPSSCLLCEIFILFEYSFSKIFGQNWCFQKCQVFPWGSLFPWFRAAVLLGHVCWSLSGVAVSPAPQAFLGQSTLQLISLLLSKLLSSVRLSPRDCSHHLYWRFGCLQILQWHIYRLSFALCTQMAKHNDTMYFTSLILRG